MSSKERMWKMCERMWKMCENSFLPLVLKGCVDRARKTSRSLTAEYMQIINNKRSKEKNKK